MRKISVAILSFLFVAGSFTLSQAQTADEIINQYLELMGGADAWKAVNSMQISGTTTMQGMAFPINVTSSRPNKQKVEVDIQGKKLIDAFDGEKAWTINPFMGSMEPQLKTEEETQEAATQMFEDEFIDYQKKGHTVSLEGTEAIGGTECYKIKMVKADGDELFYFFDKEIFVPVMTRTFAKSGPMKGQPIEVFTSDYEEVDGLMIPFSIEQKLNGQTFMTMNAEEIKLNVEVEEGFFSMPSGN